MKTIAFDIDGTWSIDPKMFHKIASYLRIFGHIPIIVTARTHGDIDDFYRLRLGGCHSDLPIFFTKGKPKKAYMESQGIKVDVWIDDDPASICGCSKLEDQEDL